jgi:hypothetical protein
MLFGRPHHCAVTEVSEEHVSVVRCSISIIALSLLVEPSPSITVSSLVTHDCACACTSCTEVGSTANPLARDITADNTAAIKMVVFPGTITQNTRSYV